MSVRLKSTLLYCCSAVLLICAAGIFAYFLNNNGFTWLQDNYLHLCGLFIILLAAILAACLLNDARNLARKKHIRYF